MCGRFSLTQPKEKLEKRFNSIYYIDDIEKYHPIPNYNVAPTHMIPIITGNDCLHFQLSRWGLIPHWSKDVRIGAKMINARRETLLEKPSFMNLLKSKRCIIPMDGFYEWKKNSGIKVPFRIKISNQEIFSVAGLWDTWHSTDNNEIINSCTIITLPANEFMSSIHERMPAILMKENENLWLDEEILPSEALNMVAPYSSDLMECYQVSSKINSVYENSEDLIEPLEENGLNDNGKQLSLF